MSNPVGPRSHPPLPPEGAVRAKRWEYRLRGSWFDLSLGVVVLKPDLEEPAELQVLEPGAEPPEPVQREPRALGPGEPEGGPRG
jgi:hypothetical protein